MFFYVLGLGLTSIYQKINIDKTRYFNLFPPQNTNKFRRRYIRPSLSSPLSSTRLWWKLILLLQYLSGGGDITKLWCPNDTLATDGNRTSLRQSLVGEERNNGGPMYRLLSFLVFCGLYSWELSRREKLLRVELTCPLKLAPLKRVKRSPPGLFEAGIEWLRLAPGPGGIQFDLLARRDLEPRSSGQVASWHYLFFINWKASCRNKKIMFRK